MMHTFHGFHCDFPVTIANMSITGFYKSIKLHSVSMNLRMVWGNYPAIVNALCQIGRVTEPR